MTQARSASPPSWKPAFIILAFFTLLSLAANAFLLWVVWNGWQLYQQQGPAIREKAGQMGRALQESVQQPLTMEITIDERMPVYHEVPIDHTIDVVVDDVASVDKTYNFEWDLPVIGLVTKTLPIHFDVPIHIETAVDVSLTVPISLSVPVKLDVPIEIDMMDLPLGAELVRLGKTLEDLSDSELIP